MKLNSDVRYGKLESFVEHVHLAYSRLGLQTERKNKQRQATKEAGSKESPVGTQARAQCHKTEEASILNSRYVSRKQALAVRTKHARNASELAHRLDECRA